MYLALARKYRPQRFADLIGQTSISKTLQNAIELNKVYPAMIFSGMKGVGKTSTARIFAKALNCERGPSTEPCNECEICREITEDTSADYMEIDGASNNGVNEVRSLREIVKYKPMKNRFRVVVIDEVHMLTGAAWNALLKTIEEPPDHTLFIMATTDFHKIPATIVSRCQHFEFKRIPLEIIKNVLSDICGKENIQISDYALYLISRSAEGSLRDAKKILDQSIALSSGNVQDQDVVEILGIIDEELFIQLTRSVLSQDRRGIIEHISSLVERGTDLRFFYNEYLKFLLNLLVIKSIEQSEKLHTLNPENVIPVREMLKGVGEIELLRYFNTLKEMEQTIKNTDNPLIMTEFIFLKLSFFPQLVSIEEVLQMMKEGKKGPAVEPPSLHPPPSFPDRKAAVDIEAFIREFREKIEAARPRMASVIQVSSIRFQDPVMYIEVPGNMENAWKIMKEQRDSLQQMASDLMGKEISLEILLQEKKPEEENSERIKKIREDKAIQSFRETIRGKLIAVESIDGGTKNE